MTANVRLEWVVGPTPSNFANSGTSSKVSFFGTAQDLTVTSPSTTVSSAAPNFNGVVGYARLICSSGAVVAAVGSAVSAGSGVVVNSLTGPVLFPVQAGQTIALIEDATYAVSTGGTGGGGASAVSTAAAPSYSQGATVNLSTDLSGNLRTTPKITDVQTTSATITVVDVNTASAAGQNGVSVITGTPTAGSSVSQSISGQTATRIQITGTWTGTLEFEGSIDGATFVPMSARIVGTTYTAQTVTGNGLFLIDVAGLVALRVRATAAMTGTASVQMTFTSNSGAMQVLNPVRIVDNTSGQQVAVDTHRSIQAVIYDSSGNPIDYTQPSNVSGTTAAGSSITANPVTIGGRVAQAAPTALTDGQVVNTMHDKVGKLVAIGALRIMKGVQQTTLTTTTETTIVSAISNAYADVYGLAISNTSSTGVYVTIKDSTAGTTRFVIYVPANDTRGFMLTVDSAVPQSSLNNNWTATLSASASSVNITALYVQNI